MHHILILIGLSFSNSHATSVNTQCVENVYDKYEPNQMAKKGKFKGQCLDASTVRPPVFVSESPEAITYANFFKDKKWWLARIPKKAVAKVYYQIVPFASNVPYITAAHTQFRFILKKDKKIELTSQIVGNRDTTSMDDVIISSTFTAPKGQEYNVFKSFGGSYGIVTRALYSADRAREEIVKDKSTVHQYELKMIPDEMNDLFYAALKQASDSGYKETYEILQNNCATVAFDNLDRIRQKPLLVDPMRGSIWNIRDEFIEPSLKALRQRDFLEAGQVAVKPMNTEMVCDMVHNFCERNW